MLKLSKGALFALAAAFCFSVMVLCTKASKLPSQEVIFSRSIFNLIASFTLLKYHNIPIFGQVRNRKYLIMRGIAGYAALSLYFYSIKFLPIGIASLIQYMSPVFSGIFAYLLIKESSSKNQWICLLLGLLGISFMTKVLPFGKIEGSINWVYWLCCLASAALSGLAYSFVRKLSIRQENPEVTVFYFPLISLPFSLFFMLGNLVIPNALQWLHIVIIGITSYLGQVFLTYSLQLEKTVTATNMLYFGALFATIWGILFFNEQISIEFCIGAALIVGSQIIFGNKKLPKEDPLANEKLSLD
jgi:drug/metabolite transporter (DMT)-like permease